jgi:hypothetical protein
MLETVSPLGTFDFRRIHNPKGNSTLGSDGVWSSISSILPHAGGRAVLGSKDFVNLRPLLKTECFSALLAG